MRSLTPISILLLIISITLLSIKLKGAVYFTIGALISLFFQLILKQNKKEKMIIFNFLVAFGLALIEIFMIKNGLW